MQCYTELIPPSAVTHAVSLPFLGSNANNLVVAKTSLLQVFELNTIATDVNRATRERNSLAGEQDGFATSDALHRTENTCKLVLIGEYPLSGTVTSLARVKTLTSKTGGDALLIATKDAKLSLVDWDPENHRISTVSIHYYEGDKVATAPFSPALAECDSYLSVDPSSRCAALKFGTKHLAILPFRQSGDDLVDEHYDPDLDPPPASAPAVASKTGTAEDGTQKETPYSASFVLPLTAIDPSLTHPVHLAFLHEYREPTFGVVFSNKAASHALLDVRKDPLTYSVFTLDLEQRASTTLLTVPGLPYDIFRVIPLPLPVGGALLVGANELVYVDQAGKTNAVGVNEFARYCSNFSMADQSDLALRLEDCQIEPLDPVNGDMLIVLNTGRLAILTFRIDGRSVSGLNVRMVDSSQGGATMSSSASCAAGLGRGRLFLGSEDGDSRLLGWSKKAFEASRKRSHAQMLAEDANVELSDEEMDDDADDDLYGEETSAVKEASVVAAEPSEPGSYTFRVHDTLFNLGPINSVCLGRNIGSSATTKASAPLSLLAATGRFATSTLAYINRELTPSHERVLDLPKAQSIWSVCAKAAAPRGLPKPEEGEQDIESQMAPDNQFDQYLIVSDGDETSRVFSIDNSVDPLAESHLRPTVYTEIAPDDFDSEGDTLEVGVLASGTRIVRVRKHDIISYDADFSLSQIMPIEDENTGAEMTVVHAFFCDPYLLLFREDSSIQVFGLDSSNDLEDLDRSESILSQKWISGCLYKSGMTDNKPLAFLLNQEGGLSIYELPNLQQPIYTAPHLSFLPPVLTAANAPRRAAGRETLTEILFADLGDANAKSPYLILRSATDDLIIYEPFHHPSKVSSSFTTNLRFRKVPGMYLPRYNDDPSLDRPMPLRVMQDVGGFATVFMPGGSPCFIIKEAASLPHVVSLRGKGVRGLCGLNSRKLQAGFTYVDVEGTICEGCLPTDTKFTTNGWTVRKFSPFSPDHEIQRIAYHAERDVYIMVTCERQPFYPPEDDHKHPAADEEISMRPTTFQYYVHLYDPRADRIINTLPLPTYELVTSLTVAPLEVSEVTHKHKVLAAVGTISQRAENYAAKGAIYVLDIIDVVPEPDQPETGKQLQVLSREDTKAGITALTGIAGLLATAQGQKMMVRGLREDGSCLPVAFLDAQCYMVSLKTMGSSKLWLAADAWEGLWFGGFGEEPYKLSVFGKSRSKMEVVAMDFLPFEGQLYLIVVDANLDMHVLQYDPEHPKSLTGQRLLHRSTFHIGHLPTSMTLLPSTLAPFSEQPITNGEANDDSPVPTSDAPALQHILVTTQSGSLALLTPLDETTYRRLSALQTTLTSILEHPAGLNPRAYRAVESEGLGARGIVDGDLICRVGELGAGKKTEVLGRAGAEVWSIKSDLEIISGHGLGYL